MSYQCMHNKLADKHAQLARDFQGFQQRMDSQTARINSMVSISNATEAASNAAIAKLAAAEGRIAALEGELATMRMALCEIRKAQHDNDAATAANGKDRQWMGGQPGGRRKAAQVPASLLRAARRSRQDAAAKGGW